MSSNNQHELLEIDKFLKKSHFLKLTNDAAFKACFKSNKQLLIFSFFNKFPIFFKLVNIRIYLKNFLNMM